MYTKKTFITIFSYQKNVLDENFIFSEGKAVVEEGKFGKKIKTQKKKRS